MYTQEDFDALPEAFQKDYVKSGDVYVHISEPKISSLKTSLDNLDGKLKETEKQKAAELAAKELEYQAELERKLEEATNASDIKKAQEVFKQQMADALKRNEADVRAKVESEYTAKQAANRQKQIVREIGLALGVDQTDAENITDLLEAKQRVIVDPVTGDEIYHDASGSAISGDMKVFMEELKKEARFKRFIKADVPTTGGGLANGSNGGGATFKSLNEMTATEEAIFATKYPERYTQLLNAK